jgi:hypothetical protein
MLRCSNPRIHDNREGAVPMNPQFEPFVKYSETLTGLVKELVDIQTSSFAKLNALQKDAVAAWYESGVAQLQTAKNPVEYKDWVDQQAKYIGEQGARAQKLSVDYLKVLEDGHSAFAAWLQKGTESLSHSAGEIFKAKAA